MSPAFASFVVAVGVCSVCGGGCWVQFCSDEQVSDILWSSEGYYWWVGDGCLQSVGSVKD